MAEDLFDERNAFLDLLLGLISVSERALSAVTELAEPDAPVAGARRPLPPDGRMLR